MEFRLGGFILFYFSITTSTTPTTIKSCILPSTLLPFSVVSIHKNRVSIKHCVL